VKKKSERDVQNSKMFMFQQPPQDNPSPIIQWHKTLRLLKPILSGLAFGTSSLAVKVFETNKESSMMKLFILLTYSLTSLILSFSLFKIKGIEEICIFLIFT
jgi:hypothetical protein